MHLSGGRGNQLVLLGRAALAGTLSFGLVLYAIAAIVALRGSQHLRWQGGQIDIDAERAATMTGSLLLFDLLSIVGAGLCAGFVAAYVHRDAPLLTGLACSMLPTGLVLMSRLSVTFPSTDPWAWLQVAAIPIAAMLGASIGHRVQKG
ncbi:MAG: hypothetical protein ACK6DP_09815 [Gemmatimonas sp.]|jgi:hypothetical protein|uniref:hypothetical protein n=1 Tax=Gemmatimonas sp. TaxID=1962908 RepID=UPI00391F505F|nr:hypothetical protein [Gemmatimonadota bacterium]